jgi:sugar phosphate isomerase/epimerase
MTTTPYRSRSLLSRRNFLVLSATLPLALRSAPLLDAASPSIPIGLEMYSVRESLKKDPVATVRAVAEMGYQGLEFYAPYFDWSETEAKQMRKLLDELGIRCFSTHNDSAYFAPDKIHRAADLNHILGSEYLIMASSQPKPGVEGWKEVAETLNKSAGTLEPSGLKVGYHNHQPEFAGAPGQRPIEIIAKNTKPSVVLQLDVGTCLESGADPVAWIRANPGRIRSIHCKDWSPDAAKGYAVLFGEGAADWKNIFAAAESVGDVEYYLMEQEGSRFPEIETAQRCLELFRAKRKEGN